MVGCKCSVRSSGNKKAKTDNPAQNSNAVFSSLVGVINVLFKGKRFTQVSFRYDKRIRGFKTQIKLTIA